MSSRILTVILACAFVVAAMLVGACAGDGPPDSDDGGPSSTAKSSSVATSSATTGATGGAPSASSSSAISSASVGQGGGQDAGHLPWDPNCVGPTSDGDPTTGCDDGNPCTEDVVADAGGCLHLVVGAGFPCSSDGLMQCWEGQCCPTTEPPECDAEGERAGCAEGSVCFEGVCWLACASDADCAGTEFPTCAPKSAGALTVEVCR